MKFVFHNITKHLILMSLTPHLFHLLKKISENGFLLLEELGYSDEEIEKIFSNLEASGHLMKVENSIELTPQSKMELELEEKKRKGEWISKEEKSKISKVSKNTLYLP